MKSKISELMQELERYGKLTILSDTECEQIYTSINDQMTEFRYQLAKKQAQSIQDTHQIIINC